jgi:hypothetical protein
MRTHLSGLPMAAVVCAALGAACNSTEVPSAGTGGTTSNTGGAAMGGQAVSGGQTGSGGATASGGAPGGGTATGGKATGGAPSGGAATGGKATGGAPSGGTATGGKATGGASTGGKATGGAAGSGGKPYKGVANSPAGEIAALGASWCYNWGLTPQASDCNAPYFVPMVWGGGDVAGAIQRITAAGYTTVLGFNEPNKSDQANLTVAQAIALWPAMTSNPNLRVSSPAVSDDGRAWLVDFMNQVKSNGLRVDFIAMHWYGWNAGSCTASQLQGAVNWAQQWNLPIWITEFGCMGSSNPDEQTLLNFFPAALTMLNSHALVERYAWYPWNTYNELYKPDSNNVRQITALGKLFAAAPAYR